jgi:thioredoxin 1
LAAEYGVMSIPTLIRFQNGQETGRVVGALPKAQLLKRLGL